MTEKEFVSRWIAKLASEGIKNFPADFINSLAYKDLKLPVKPLLIGKELFGTYEIITVDGKSVFHAEDYLQAKFIIYSNRNTSSVIHLPVSNDEIKLAVSDYESYLDKIIKNIEADYQKYFPDLKENDPGSVIMEIFRIMNLVRV